MDKYHIYDEIGKGEFSQVFKGREKKKISYVAIKRVDKGVMNKIVSEVQIMHKLQSPHVLRFHDWYETRNNLWLILEYCTGGDLRSILNQDRHLPESSILLFGLDIISGLKYIHSSGIIHCDLQPKNLLIDEYGILKFSDFKLARKLPKTPLNDTPMNQRGSISYMAPELLTPEGAHSYASDLWSLGCVLYELRRGYTPFGSETDDESNIIRRINDVDINKIPKDLNKAPEDLTTFSANLFDLIQWLLEKSLLNRCGWPELVKHSFWGTSKIAFPDNLPQQHLFEDQIRSLQRQRTEKMEEQVLQELDRQSLSQFSSKDLGLPPPPNLLDNTPIRPKQRPVTLNSSTEKGINGGLYSSPVVPKTGINNNNNNINNNDHNNNNHNSNNNISSSNFNNNQQTPSSRKISEDIDSGYKSNRGGPIGDGGREDPNNRSHNSNASNENSFAASTDSSSRAHSIISFRDASLLNLYDSCLMHNSDFQVKPLVGNKNIEPTERSPFNANNLPFQGLPLIDLLKKKPEELELHLSSIYKSLHKCMNTVFAEPNSRQYSAAALSAAIDESNDILCYLCSISSSTEVANVVFNTKFLSILLKVLSSSNSYWIKKGSSPAIKSSDAAVEVPQKTVVATLLGVFLRYATLIEPPDPRNKSEGVIPVFVEILSSKTTAVDVKLQRKMIAALGEMLFYIVAQDDSSAGESSSKKEWYYLDEAINLLITVFLESKDNICTHFAVKTLENILSQGSMEYRLKLIQSNPAIFKRMLQFALTGYTEAFQISCAFSLVHSINLVLKNANASNAPNKANNNKSMNTGHLVEYILELFSDSAVTTSVFELWQDISSMKLQQAFLTIFCLFYLYLDGKRLAMLNINHLSVIQIVVKLLDQSSSTVIRGKSLILIGLMTMASPPCIVSLPERKIVSILVRVLDPQMSSQIGLNSQPNFDFLVKPSELLTKVIISLMRGHVSALMEELNEMHNCPGHKRDLEREKFAAICDRASLYLNNLQVLFSFSSHISIRKHVFHEELNRFVTFYSRTVTIIRQTIVDINALAISESRIGKMQSMIERVNKFIYISIEILTQTDLLRVENESADIDSKHILSIQSFSSDLIPLLFSMFNDTLHEDSRLVSITCLRRFFAVVMKSILVANRTKDFDIDSLYRLFSEFVGVVSSGLIFDNPIPQHAVRALEETMAELDGQAPPECSSRISSIVLHSSLLSSLCGLLGTQIRTFDEGFVDIHLLTMIRKVIDIHSENFELKISDLPTNLIALTKRMCDSFKSSNEDGGGDNDSSENMPKSAYMELFLHVVDTIHLILNISIRVLASAVKNPSASNRNIENLKQWNAPLSGFISMIVSILSYFNSKNEVDISIYGHFIRQLDLDESMRKMLLDVSSRCFGIMFDLFPEKVIEEIQLCVRSHNINSFSVIASVLNNAAIDPRIMLRIVKMSAGIIRICQSVNNSNCDGCRKLIKTSTLEVGLRSYIFSLSNSGNVHGSGGGSSSYITGNSPNTPPTSSGKHTSSATKAPQSETAKYCEQIKDICTQLQNQIAKL